MALVKCKECGNDISSKAKTCPNCGAKKPKKTSKFKWLILIILVIGIYAAIQPPSSSDEINSADNSSQAATKSTQPIKSKPQEPSWTTSVSKDEMTGEKSAYASSPTVTSKKAMDFPYNNTKAWLGVGCNGEREWVYIGFTKEPNLNDTELEDGYNLIQTRIRWDGNIENVTLTQKWGASFIHFDDDDSAIHNIMNSKKALLELQWHGQQSTYFEFPLRGSSASIETIRAQFNN